MKHAIVMVVSEIVSVEQKLTVGVVLLLAHKILIDASLQ